MGKNIQELEEKKERAHREIRSYEVEIARLEKKINRLEEAKRKMKTTKGSLSGHVIETNWLCAVEGWSGIMKEQYQTKFEEELSCGLERYYDKVDQIHDYMNREISRLKNEMGNLEGGIQSWWSCLRDLTTMIENALN